MRDVYSNHSNYVGMSRKLKKHILANFTEEQMTTKFANAVCKADEASQDDWLSEISDIVKQYE